MKKYYVESRKEGRKEGRSIPHEIKERKANWFGHVLRKDCCLKHATEGQIKGRTQVAKRLERRKQIPDDLEDKTRFCKFKEKALDRTLSRTGFGKCNGPVVRQDYKMQEGISK
jgi:hypothetical protein